MRQVLLIGIMLLGFSKVFCADLWESEEIMVSLLNQKGYSYSKARLSLLQLESYRSHCNDSLETSLKRLFYCYKESELFSELSASNDFLKQRQRVLEMEISKSTSQRDLQDLMQIIESNPKFKNKLNLRLRELEYIGSE